MSAYFDVQSLSHRYSHRTTFQDIDFSLQRGEILSLLGESGQGKSTLLLCLAGLERPDSGVIRMGERVLFGEGIDCPAQNRKMGFVFQEHSLFPHLDVRGNIAFGTVRGGEERGSEWMDLFGLSECEKKFPFELSGGQQQRAAMAQALASAPEVLLLDEPFAHLDRRLRLRLRRELRRILKSKSVTSIFVTHDREEAFDMGDRVGVLNGGTVEQVDTPYNLYHFPRSLFVARFVGSGLFLPGTVSSESPGRAETLWGGIPLQNREIRGAVEVYWPASAVDVSTQRVGHSVRGKVVRKLFRGEGYCYDIRIEEIDRIFESLSCSEDCLVGGEVFVAIKKDRPAMAFPWDHSAR